ncbi:tRNA lysidine(34) synthetase TilS [Aquabacterium sp. A7-Y]|uniref:tRNA lysidine(34) synthetase TilS n=1 Tax=Aquabacterium sp. A7-Y TaxID=1349605 RepID=UPI00223D9E8D|nr:tRNA lysidine(34) synthetase TilS [Aquabacterium sp. A7-Y]MCW7537797.1 tRNA lysidine(34) synthetase TilS [Aquabacterium sp. A7-Y]
MIRRALQADRPVVAVAYSGGRDSTALLHATAQAAHEQGVEVLALHVHHGLQPRADDWLAHCERQCAAWRRKGWPLTLVSRRLELAPGRGDSVEAVARKARYQALHEMAQSHGAGIVLLAHHRRDQAETFLLQALRGAGVAGLAGMPQAAERAGVVWTRPWLEHPREAVEAYVRQHRLRYIDDDSNSDPRYARNRLRLQVWPALTAAFPQAEATLSDAGTWARDASVCLAELAELDLAALQDEDDALRLSPLLKLGAARARNTLRHWYRRLAGQPLPAAALERLWAELPGAGAAQWELPAGMLRCYRGRLSFSLRPATPAASGPARQARLQIRRAGRYRLAGWGGTLVARRVAAGGVALPLLAELTLAERSGGEQFQSGPGRPPRSLKKQFQAQGVPAWARSGPLLYAGERLLWVPGLGIDARARAGSGEAQVSLDWLPDEVG